MLKSLFALAKTASAVHQLLSAASAAVFITHGLYRFFRKGKKQ
jgi:hypothetical protein